MANAMYTSAKTNFFDAALDYSASNIKAILVDTAQYTFAAGHDFLNDINSTARIATSPALTAKTITGGVFDAGDTTVTAVSGATVEALVLYHSAGADSTTSPLVAYIDTGTGLPFTPNGGDVIIRWNASGIITIVG